MNDSTLTGTHEGDQKPAAPRSSDGTGASCGGCARRWAGLSQAHCPSCHRHFGSVFGFDAHRARGACHDPGDIIDRHGKHVLAERKGPYGVTWVRNVDRPHPQAHP